MTYSHVLSEIYDSTYRMLELAQGKQWAELQEASNNRTVLLQKLHVTNIENDCEDEIEKKLKEIIEVNQLITFLSIQEKDSCLTEIYQFKTSKKATHEYSRY